MKRALLILSMTVMGTVLASQVNAQISIHANLNLPLPPIPHVHVYAETAPAVVYQDDYAPNYYPYYPEERVVVTDPGCRYDGYYRGYRDYRYERFHDRHYRDYDEHDRGRHEGWGRREHRRW